ncbi:MAG: signal peptidase I [Agriterribacter sp.]
MKPIVKVLITVCVVITTIWIVARATNALQFYRIPTTSNEPAIKAGSYILASNLVNPERFKFVCYKREDAHYGKQTFVHRICGIEGDTIQIKKGILLVNGRDVDKNRVLSFQYKISTEEFNLLNKKHPLSEDAYFPDHNGDSVFVNTNIKDLQSTGINAVRYIDYNNFNQEIKNTYTRDWSPNSFGPVVVPKGKYFVLGDNRDNALDSRFIGFIDKTDCVGTVLEKK